MDKDVDKQGADLGEAIINAMLAWADRNTRQVDARVPIIALHYAVMSTLGQLAYEKRRAYAEDLIRGIRKSLDRGAS